MADFTCPRSPTHATRVVREGRPDRSGFCLACNTHYSLCPAFQNMGVCTREEDHEDKHRDAYGTEW